MVNISIQSVVSVTALGILISGLLINIPNPTPATVNIETINVEKTEEKKQLKPIEPVITREQSFWLKKLRICESSDNPLAINNNDRDGLPAYGLYQFKYKTWKYYIKKYNLFNWRSWESADFENAIWSREHQEIVLRNMLNDKKVIWSAEFPDCVLKIGLPPK